MALRRPEETFVRSAADLAELWRDLMGRGGFAQRTLWMIFLYGDGQLSPVVAPIDDVPATPDAELLEGLARTVAQVVGDFDGTAAFLLSRPGWPQMTDDDRRWARTLRTVVDPQVSPWPMHLATRDRVQVFAPDDLV